MHGLGVGRKKVTLETRKPVIKLAVGYVALLSTIPVGMALASIPRGYDDPAGEAMANGFIFFMTVCVLFPLISIYLAIITRKSWKSLNLAYRFLGIAPTVASLVLISTILFYAT